MLLFYLPVAIGGFLVFGSNLKSNIINNLQNNWIRTTILVLITGHLLTAFNIILNPVFQGVEHAFNAPPSNKQLFSLN
jgi:vesicular inhibitory amino acid transporter